MIAFNMLDNARPHTSKSTAKWLPKHFQILHLPPQSPELNPIETIFAIMKKRVQDHNPKNLKNLNLLLKKTWRTLPKKFIKRTIVHTKEICKIIIKYHGNNDFK